MPEIYTTKEAAQILKIHPGIVRMYIRDGKIKSFKVGNRIRIKQPDLLEFMENQEQKQETKQK